MASQPYSATICTGKLDLLQVLVSYSCAPSPEINIDGGPAGLWLLYVSCLWNHFIYNFLEWQYTSLILTVRVADIHLVPDIAESGGWWGHWLHPRRLCIETQRSATILSDPGHCSWGDRTQELWVTDRRWHIFSDQVITVLDLQQFSTLFDSGTASTFAGTWHFAQLAEICIGHEMTWIPSSSKGLVVACYNSSVYWIWESLTTINTVVDHVGQAASVSAIISWWKVRWHFGTLCRSSRTDPARVEAGKQWPTRKYVLTIFKQNREQLQIVADLVGAGKLKPIIGAIVPIAEAEWVFSKEFLNLGSHSSYSMWRAGYGLIRFAHTLVTIVTDDLRSHAVKSIHCLVAKCLLWRGSRVQLIMERTQDICHKAPHPAESIALLIFLYSLCKLCLLQPYDL